MSENKIPKVEARENGPLMVANVTSLTGTDGQSIETKPVMALCRCGLSQNKPFCDGAHKREGFDAAAGQKDRADKIYSYKGAEIEVHFSKLLCSHAAECAGRLPAVFNTTKRPWVSPDNGTAAEIKDVIHACPSGALQYSEVDSGSLHITDNKVAIKVDKNGPYRVRNIPLIDGHWADSASHTKYVLCRCGLSASKPFCDGSHRDQKWSDEA